MRINTDASLGIGFQPNLPSIQLNHKTTKPQNNQTTKQLISLEHSTKQVIIRENPSAPTGAYKSERKKSVKRTDPSHQGYP